MKRHDMWVLYEAWSLALSVKLGVEAQCLLWGGGAPMSRGVAALQQCRAWVTLHARLSTLAWAMVVLGLVFLGLEPIAECELHLCL